MNAGKKLEILINIETLTNFSDIGFSWIRHF